jgi:hypothetical protein
MMTLYLDIMNLAYRIGGIRVQHRLARASRNAFLAKYLPKFPRNFFTNNKRAQRLKLDPTE